MQLRLKNIHLFCMILLAFLLISSDFKQVNWGDSVFKVKKSEPIAPLYETADELIYLSYILDMKGLLTYQFDNGKLIRAVFSITEEYSTEKQYNDVYEKLFDSLVKMFSTPYLNEKNNKTVWVQQRTIIELRLDKNVKTGKKSFIIAFHDKKSFPYEIAKKDI